MNTRITCSVAAMAVLLSGFAASAQDKMEKPMMGKEKSYTGCVEAGSMANSFSLAHATAEMAMGKDAMAKDSMAKDAMKKDTMGKMDMANLSLASKSVDLAKHVGHKVTVTGTEDMLAKDAMGKSAHVFNVTALKMVAATCGM